ncbi:MAG TPA: 4-alpha-glucanotransferase, partial [Gammaproteobacteria bacterium]|nr:4-alpha-glucanotransferase [Gammaproteobacteria bacterium]
PQVRYREVAELKFPMLEEAYRHFRRQHLAAENSLHARAFREFQRERGATLRRFATFHVLAESHDEFDWRSWPANERDPASETVASFVLEREERIEFHEYLQWQCDGQLRAAAAKAHAAGMSIGLYRDLAVGADANGAETWSAQRTIVAGAAVGAPPDQLNLDGQNWGFPPPDPRAWQAENYVSFRELLRANMRHAGAMRMDHVLGLVRLWWIPAGARARDGAYQRYPWSELLAVLAETSRQERCLVIGEDLGTVPQGLREAMRGNGILSCRLLYFERRGRNFAAPQEYPPEALVAAATHDLPTLAAWWHGDDIALRDRLGLWPDAGQRASECNARIEDREALLRALREQGIANEEDGEEAPIAAVHRFLARTPCRLLMVQLEDALGARTQLNVPGTTDEYPNWRLRLPCELNEVLSHPRMRRIAAAMHEEGRSDRQPP